MIFGRTKESTQKADVHGKIWDVFTALHVDCSLNYSELEQKQTQI